MYRYIAYICIEIPPFDLHISYVSNYDNIKKTDYSHNLSWSYLIIEIIKN